MRTALLAVALLPLTAAVVLPQQAVDTSVTLAGFLQHEEEVNVWTIVVPLPIAVLGIRTYVVPLVGKPEKWDRYVGRYIEASGRITSLPERGNPPIGMEIEKAKEVAPPGTARAIVDHSVNLRAEITLSVIPNRFSWRDSTGASTGVNPLILYTIVNQRTAPIFFILPTSRFVCVTLKTGDGVTVWDSTTHVQSPDARRFTLQRAGGFREAFRFPEDAATRPGRYFVQVGICDVDDYDVTGQFDVL